MREPIDRAIVALRAAIGSPLVSAILRHRVPGGGFVPAGEIDPIGVDADEGLGEVTLLGDDPAAIETGASADFAGEALGECSLGLDVAAWIGAGEARSGGDRLGEGGVGAGQQVNMDVVADIAGGAHFGRFPGLPLTQQIGAKAQLFERARGIGDDEFADRDAGGLAIKAHCDRCRITAALGAASSVAANALCDSA
jgi:hypothetical protein